MRYGCPVLAPAEGGEDEEYSKPDNDLVPHEHPCWAENQGEEAGSVRLILLRQFGRVIMHYVFDASSIHINNIQ